MDYEHMEFVDAVDDLHVLSASKSHAKPDLI